jgi:GNAT superfamily N-acetyltransferase
MRAVSPPLPAADDTASRAVLRDGSVVQLRMAAPSDHQALTRFFHELSPESRRLRFFAISEPSDVLLTRFCDSTDLSRNATLLALRLDGGELRPIAVGSYFSTGDATAEVAFAVDDRFHGKGLGTMLLERLAAIAGAHGFKRFEATTLTENAAMLEVFHESGFEIRS